MNVTKKVLHVPWTEDERYLLLSALEKHGENLEAIDEEIPFKTITEIRVMIDKYRKLASESLNKGTTKAKDAHIEKWMTILKQMSGKAPLHEVSRALKYIALFEKRTDAADVNLRECYLMLSDLMTGIATKDLDPRTEAFMKQCTKQLAKKLKGRDLDNEREFLEHLSLEKGVVKTYAKKGSTIANVQSNPVVNPLQVPKNLLVSKETT